MRLDRTQENFRVPHTSVAIHPVTLEIQFMKKISYISMYTSTYIWLPTKHLEKDLDGRRFT